MTAAGKERAYLDWNASAPLRPEARAAMMDALDVTGNPSSVHREGRGARAIVEKARGQVARLAGCDPDEVIFTSGATEAAAILAAVQPHGAVCVDDCAHDALIAHLDLTGIETGSNVLAMGLACGETGRLMNVPERDAQGFPYGAYRCGSLLLDVTQAIGRVAWSFAASQAHMAILSAHKIGGPKGSGALILRDAIEIDPILRGGGQEKGRRSGTENVAGIAGFGAAAEAARQDLEAGAWDEVENLRNSLEDRLADAAPDTIFFARDTRRLANTACFAVPGWAGETQVMQMDLAGFAVSAGSACSSGKVAKASRVLLAMGADEAAASSAIRVSMGPTTTAAEVAAFADAWIDAYRRRNARVA